jgi:HEPN domain-containing protein
MGADSARAEDTQAWMRRAREDLRAGRTMLDAKPPLLGPAAFHSPQAAEKA